MVKVLPAFCSLLASPAVLRVLLHEVSRLADVVRCPLSDVVARLEPGAGRPCLTIDSTSPPQDQAWALLDALRELTGVGPAEWGRPVRHLRVVC